MLEKDGQAFVTMDPMRGLEKEHKYCRALIRDGGFANLGGSWEEFQINRVEDGAPICHVETKTNVDDDNRFKKVEMTISTNESSTMATKVYGDNKLVSKHIVKFNEDCTDHIDVTKDVYVQYAKGKESVLNIPIGG